MKNKRGFTLIELLAVIIILGVIMLIAIPSVTRFINDSRKKSYIDTAQQYIKGAITMVNSGELDIYDTSVTYYIPSSCINVESGGKSPYGGEFSPAYIIVTYDNNSYNFYWMSTDNQKMGIKTPTSSDRLEVKLIEPNVDKNDVLPTTGIDGRRNIIEFTEDCTSKKDLVDSTKIINGKTGMEIKEYVCQRATTLHQANCPENGVGCKKAGYGIGNKDTTITYGTIPNESPKIGDAYDCDVNGDGVYNSENERFYLVDISSTNYSLIYYTNVVDGINPTRTQNFSFDTRFENWNGPTVAYNQLPNKYQWTNKKLIMPGVRQIQSDTGENVTSNMDQNNTVHQLELFDYNDKVARFLTFQEVINACGTCIYGHEAIGGYLNNCIFFLENIGQFDSNYGTYGYYLETVDRAVYYYTRIIHGENNSLNRFYTNNGNYYGVRPVITINKNDLE